MPVEEHYVSEAYPADCQVPGYFDLSAMRYSIIVLVARDNRLMTLHPHPLVAHVQQVLLTITPGAVVEVSSAGASTGA